MRRLVCAIAAITLPILFIAITHAGNDKKDVMIRRVYVIEDLAVFKDSKAGSEFDASILIAYLQTTVAPESWMESGQGEAELQPFEKNKSLVVSQTDANHEKIVDALEALRKPSKH